jgi:hypothetical protein
LEEIFLVFAQGGKVGSDGAKSLNAMSGTEAARDFLFEFRHANISLCLIVIERHVVVGGEAQHIVSIVM